MRYLRIFHFSNIFCRIHNFKIFGRIFIFSNIFGKTYSLLHFIGDKEECAMFFVVTDGAHADVSHEIQKNNYNQSTENISKSYKIFCPNLTQVKSTSIPDCKILYNNFIFNGLHKKGGGSQFDSTYSFIWFVTSLVLTGRINFDDSF